MSSALVAASAARSQHTQPLVRRKVYISFTPIDHPPNSSSKGFTGRSPFQGKTAFLNWMAVLDGFHGMPPEHAKKGRRRLPGKSFRAIEDVRATAADVGANGNRV
jgi:hypothetical protein